MNRINRVVVPDVKYSVPENVAEVLRPLKEIADRLSGLRPGVPALTHVEGLALMPMSTLTDAINKINDCVNKINEIITRLQS